MGGSFNEEVKAAMTDDEAPKGDAESVAMMDEIQQGENFQEMTEAAQAWEKKSKKHLESQFEKRQEERWQKALFKPVHDLSDKEWDEGEMTREEAIIKHEKYLKQQRLETEFGAWSGEWRENVVTDEIDPLDEYLEANAEKLQNTATKNRQIAHKKKETAARNWDELGVSAQEMGYKNKYGAVNELDTTGLKYGELNDREKRHQYAQLMTQQQKAALWKMMRDDLTENVATVLEINDEDTTAQEYAHDLTGAKGEYVNKVVQTPRTVGGGKKQVEQGGSSTEVRPRKKSPSSKGASEEFKKMVKKYQGPTSPITGLRQ